MQTATQIGKIGSTALPYKVVATDSLRRNFQGSSAVKPIDYRRLIEAAILAPSPDNNQPWQFELLENGLLLRADPRYALPSDKDDLFCWMALGAAAENICMAACEQGHAAQVTIVDEGGSQGVACLRFSFAGEATPDPLFASLATRCTSRRPYSKQAIDPEALLQLAAAAAEVGDVRVDWITTRQQIRRVAWLIGATDRVRFEYQPFHEELFKQLRFTVAEAEATRDGLDVRTLELPPGAASLLKRLRSWRVMQGLHRCGIGRALGLPSVMSAMASGAIGALSVPNRSAAAYLAAGRSFQRLWLTADSLGLSLQPMGSLPIFWAHLEDTAHCPLSAPHQVRLRAIVQQFRDLLPASQQPVLAMLFRLGQAKPITIRSLRRRFENFTPAS